MGVVSTKAKCRMLITGGAVASRCDRGPGLMADYWIWWVLAALLVAAELMTGTFYLLAAGVAFAVGGVAALAGDELPL